MDALQNALAWQVGEPPGGDVRISAFASAVGGALSTPGLMQEFVAEVYRVKPEFGSSHLATKLLRATQRQLLDSYPDYPGEFLTPNRWYGAIQELLTDPFQYGQLLTDVIARPLQTNESQRYKSLRIFSALAHRLGRLSTCSILDVGCSVNAGLKHLASGIGFEPPIVLYPSHGERKPSLDMTANMSRALQEPFQLEPSVGVDLTKPEDAYAWVRACHRPTELLDRDRMALFDALVTASYPNVSFFQGNFAAFDADKFAETYPDQKFGIVNFSTVLYQVNETERQQMLATAEQYAAEFITVQDFIRIDPEDPAHLLFRDDWLANSFPYRFVVRDMRDKSRRWHEVFKWRDGRCNELAVGLGRISLAGGGRRSAWSMLKRYATG